MGEPLNHFFPSRLKPRDDSRAAFSLVELLVVVGIIALLIALLMPVLAKARAQSKYIVCQSNLRQVGQYMLIYSNNNGGWLFPNDGGIEQTDVRLRWFIYVLKPRPPLDPNDLTVQDWTPPIMLCPADDSNPANYHSYLVNNHLPEHGLRYSSKLPVGITSDHAVVMGEKLTSATHYYVETLNGQSTYDEQVEKNRHGIGLGSNYLYLDMHVDPHGPVDTVYGMDPWDFPNLAPATEPSSR